MAMWKPRYWLCVAPAFLCLLDTGVTLCFQPPEYWAGDYNRVHEFSPVDRWMLAQHPAVFLVWVMGWIAAFCTAIMSLPTRIALGLALFLLLNNATGAGSWIGYRLPHGAWGQAALYVVTTALVIVTWSRAGVFAQIPRP